MTGFCVDEMRIIPDEEICVDWLVKEASSHIKGHDLGFEPNKKSASEYLKKYPWACDIERIKSMSSLLSFYPNYVTTRLDYFYEDKDDFLKNIDESWNHINSCNTKSRMDKYVGFGYTRKKAEQNYKDKLKNNQIKPR